MGNPWATHNIYEFYKEETSAKITISGIPDHYLGHIYWQLVTIDDFYDTLILNDDNNDNHSLTLRECLEVGVYNYQIQIIATGDSVFSGATFNFDYSINVSQMPESSQISKNNMKKDADSGYTAFCSNYNKDHQAYKAFDGLLSNGNVYWEANWIYNDPKYGVADIGQTLPSQARLTSYEISIDVPSSYGNYRIPAVWTIQGSNNGGVSWTNVGQEITHLFQDDHKVYDNIAVVNFEINQGIGDGAYSSYRMHITWTSGPKPETQTPQGLQVSEIRFYGFAED